MKNNQMKVLYCGHDKLIINKLQIYLSNLEVLNHSIEFLFITDYDAIILDENIFNDSQILLIDCDELNKTKEIINKIRFKQNNSELRIIILCNDIINQFDQTLYEKFNIDYILDKSSLDKNKIYSLLFTSIKSYMNIVSLKFNKQILENIFIEKTDYLIDEEIENLHRNGYNFIEFILNSISDGKNGFIGIFELVNGNIKECIVSEHIIYDKHKVSLNCIRSIGSNMIIDDYIYYQASMNDKISYFYICEKNKISDAQLLNLLELGFKKITNMYSRYIVDNRIRNTQKEIILKLSSVLELREIVKKSHNISVSHISKKIAKIMKYSVIEQNLIELAAPLHNIGLLAVSDLQLETLTEDFEINDFMIFDYPTMGYSMFKDSRLSMLKLAAEIAYQHKEKWDGSGYPRHLKEDEIHPFAQIVEMAIFIDVIFRKTNDIDQVIDRLKKVKNITFNPILVDTVIDHFDQVIEEYFQ